MKLSREKSVLPGLYDESTFEQLVRDHQAMVFRVLLRLLGTREHIDDLAQDVFLRFYRAMGGFRGEAQVTTYLYRIALNVARDEWKRRGHETRQTVSLSDPDGGWDERLPHQGSDPEQEMVDQEFTLVVEKHLMQLSHAERSVLVLYHQEERSYQEIALVLGVPIGTVRTHLHRGRRKLREGLESWRAKEGRTRCAELMK